MTPERLKNDSPYVSKQSTSSHISKLQRLLYRGALSLPDSHLLLDGLTFIANISDADTKLLDNPLALALESMRGRPSLRFMGLAKVKDVWIDDSIDVSLDVHPHATLSQIYLENTFCLHAQTLPDGRSEQGLRVTLGDSDSPGATEIIIFARLALTANPSICFNLPSSPSSSRHPPPPQVTLSVARILPFPPAPPIRLPRPDDPTPRLPPLIGPSKRRKIIPNDTEDVLRAREVMMGIPQNGNGKGKSVGMLVRARAKESVFKVPLGPPLSAATLAKGTFDGKGDGEVEKANKAVVKKSTVNKLAHRSITKTHSEFKDLYGHIYRGVLFALRAQMQTGILDLHLVDRLVDAHLQMYILEQGKVTNGIL